MLVLDYPAGSWATNCYVIAAAPGEPCVIIDPGQNSTPWLLEQIREQRLAPAAVLLTHGHIDHVWSVAPVTKDFGIPALIHADDRYRLEDPAGSSFLAAREQLLAMTQNALELTEPDDVRTFADQEVVDIAGVQLRVQHAPGHTEGSVVFTSDAQQMMWSGDLLFAGSIGRTDLPGGDSDAMMQSLERVVLSAPDDMQVLPGHGPATTIGDERRANPFLQALDGSSPTRGL